MLLIIARGLLYTTAAVSLLVVVQSARAGERCYIEQTQPAAAAPAVKRAPAKRSNRIVGKRQVKRDAARISALARRPVAQTTLVEVPCARPSGFKPAPLGPVVPFAWELPPTFDPITDWYATHVGPVPAPRVASVPAAGTLPLFVIGAAAVWRQRRT